MSSILPLFVTCPKGLENLLATELNDLGGQNIRETVAGVRVEGDLSFAYRCCLWSRLANKVLLALGQCPADSTDALYDGVSAIDWSAHLESDSSLWIDLSGTNDGLRHTQFAAQRVKDAIVDQLRTPSGQRPSINREKPDLRLSIRIHREQAAINIDLCGDSLHKRGYRQQAVIAPLKENLAAAILLRSQWPSIFADGGHLIDPMCGSGTLLTEAALMASDTAPGIWRAQFAFERWIQHQPSLWKDLKLEALERRELGRQGPLPEMRGYDQDYRAVKASQINAEAAGVDDMVRVMNKSLEEFKRPSHGNFDKGLLVTNPPYGERLGEQQSLLPLYEQLGDILKRDFSGWQAGVFTGNPELGKNLGLRSHKQYKLFNGAIPSELLLFSVFDKSGRRTDEKIEQRKKPDKPELSEGAQMVANRLRKNQRQLKSWIKQQGIHCYRLYDADLPEYAAAVDVYGDKIHIQEYQAPKTIDEKKAQWRLDELQQAVGEVFSLKDEQISVKQRRRTRGKQQYERLDESAIDRFDIVEEGKAKLAVNLWAYLDSGLFLDHRLVRAKVASLSEGKRLLNLFCYTGTATVHAALAGASASTSVDMSKTYLQWAQRNFNLNNIGKNHTLVQADCLQWLNQCREGFDVIFLDPPSFSNSKRMEGVLDVQRDHVSLIKRCMDLLSSKGVLIFSTNLRRFKFEYDSLKHYKVDDISQATIDKDFQRNQKIHQCFEIKVS